MLKNLFNAEENKIFNLTGGVQKSKFRNSVKKLMYATKWDEETVIRKLQIANDYGISPLDFRKNRLWRFPEEEYCREARRIVESRLAYEEMLLNRDIVRKKAREDNIFELMNCTGWTHKEAEDHVRKDNERFGCTAKEYLMYRFWELDDEQKESFFIEEKNAKITKLYNQGQDNFVITINNKEKFLKKFNDYVGRPWMTTLCMHRDEFCQKFKDEKILLYKPIRGHQGKGIEKFEVNSLQELECIYEEFMKLPIGLVEGYIEQHEDIKKFNPESVNTIRIVTIRTDKNNLKIDPKKVYFVYAGFRIGAIGSFVDNLHAGGMMAPLDVKTGEIVGNAVNHRGDVISNNPATGGKLIGLKLPLFKEVRALIEKVSDEKNIVGYYGWDIAITPKGPVIVEINNKPGADGLQIPYIHEKKGMSCIMDQFI